MSSYFLFYLTGEFYKSLTFTSVENLKTENTTLVDAVAVNTSKFNNGIWYEILSIVSNVNLNDIKFYKPQLLEEEMAKMKTPLLVLTCDDLRQKPTEICCRLGCR